MHELKDHKLDPYLKPDIFRANQYEYSVFDSYMKANNLTCKEIFDEISEKYIKKDNFKYTVNKYIVSNPIISEKIFLGIKENS